MPVYDVHPRTISSRNINGIKLKIVDEISLYDRYQHHQEFRYKLHNTPDAARYVRVVDVAELSTSTTGDSLSIEQIIQFKTRDRYTYQQDAIHALLNRDPSTRYKTHKTTIYATDEAGNKDEGTFITVERADKIWMRDEKRHNQDTVFIFHWPDVSDPEWDYTDVPEPITDYDGTNINPPWRFDPFQNVIDYGGSEILMVLHSTNKISALSFSKILSIIGVSGYTGATGGFTGADGALVYEKTIGATGWGSEKLKASVLKFGAATASTGATGTGPAPYFVMTPLQFYETSITKAATQQLTTIWNGTQATGSVAPTGATGSGNFDNSVGTNLAWYAFPLMRSEDSTDVSTPTDLFTFTGGYLSKKESWSQYGLPLVILSDGSVYHNYLWGVRDYFSEWWASTLSSVIANEIDGALDVSNLIFPDPVAASGIGGALWSSLPRFQKETLSFDYSYKSTAFNTLYDPGSYGVRFSDTTTLKAPFQVFGQTGGKDRLTDCIVEGSASLAQTINEESGFIFTEYGLTFEDYAYSGTIDTEIEDPQLKLDYIPLAFPPSLGSAKGKKYYEVVEFNQNLATVQRSVETPYGKFSKSGFVDMVATGATGYPYSDISNDFRGWLHLSNGRHYLQAFGVFGDWKVYIDQKEAGNVIADAVGVPLSDVQTMILGVPLSRVKQFT